VTVVSDQEYHDLCFLPSITGVTIKMRVICAGEVAEMARAKNTRMDMILIGKYARGNITLDTDTYMKG
jgi:ribosomal protein L1